jgi:uncharacterized membrane protein YeiH
MFDIVGTQLFTISGVSNYRQGDMFDIVGTHLFTISGVSNYRQGDVFDIVGTHLFTISGVSTCIGQADDISMPYKFLSI